LNPSKSEKSHILKGMTGEFEVLLGEGRERGKRKKTTRE